ncbi:MAG: hypothetical protein HYU52_02240 [Acidobacteria bacterium]|nr:hypothetical protein [Acidobacteriota bacterium]
MGVKDPAAVLSSERSRLVVVILLFVAFAAAGTANHEMWRDEHHAWLLARDAASPVEVYRNLRWDMTPGFWHLLLWVVTRFTHDPASMQLLNLAFATAAAWIVLRFAPLELEQRALLVFGYYLGYEYAAISRVYALGTLFIFVLCAVWERRHARAILVGVLLTLLANTPSLYGVIAAGFFLLLLALDLRGDAGARRGALVALAIGGAGTIAALWQTLPSSDNPFAAGKATLAFEPERVGRVIHFLASIFVPIPDASRYDWWNSNLVTGRSVLLDALIAAAGIALVCWLLWRRRDLLACWLLAVSGVLFAAYQGGFVGMRHGGYVFILFIAALWIASAQRKASSSSARQRLALTLLLAVGVVGGLTAWFRELSTEFSAAEKTARWMRASGLEGMPIAGADDFVVASLASLLDLDRIYYPQRGEWGTFVSWDPGRRNTTLGDATSDIASKVSVSGRPMLFVLTRPPTRIGPAGQVVVVREAMVAPGVRGRLLAAFTDSVVSDECLFVYEIAPNDPSSR